MELVATLKANLINLIDEKVKDFRLYLKNSTEVKTLNREDSLKERFIHEPSEARPRGMDCYFAKLEYHLRKVCLDKCQLLLAKLLYLN